MGLKKLIDVYIEKQLCFLVLLYIYHIVTRETFADLQDQHTPGAVNRDKDAFSRNRNIEGSRRPATCLNLNTSGP